MSTTCLTIASDKEIWSKFLSKERIMENLVTIGLYELNRAQKMFSFFCLKKPNFTIPPSAKIYIGNGWNEDDLRMVTYIEWNVGYEKVTAHITHGSDDWIYGMKVVTGDEMEVVAKWLSLPGRNVWTYPAGEKRFGELFEIKPVRRRTSRSVFFQK